MTTTVPQPGVLSPDPGRWPELLCMPAAGVRSRAARSLFLRAVRGLDLRLRLPGGGVLGRGGPAAPEMVLHRPDELFRRLGGDGLIGFGEAYMSGAWDCEDLASVLLRFAERMAHLVPEPLQRLRRFVVRTPPPHDENTREGARQNIHRHYDLSNDLFSLFLDESMTYSSALFEDSNDLATAQQRKIDAVLDAARVRAGSRVLEIGSGWGALAMSAARRGATVRTITLSAEQQALADQRIAAAGLSDRIGVELRDYRDVHGQYDAVVSVEMIEAVGEKYWPAYFQAIDRALAPGGRAGIQAITMAHDRMLATRNTYTWIQKYVFPGGLIPSVEAIERTLAEHTSLRLVQRRDFGPHYAQTLQQWRDRFLARGEDVLKLGFDRTFQRLWEFYLAYCEAGFRAGYIGVSQLTLAREIC